MIDFMREVFSTIPLLTYLVLLLPWASLVVSAAWCARTGNLKRFMACVAVVWLVTSAAFAWEARSLREVLVLSACVLVLWVLPQAGLLALLVRSRFARPLAMLAATLVLWVLQIPFAFVGLLMAGCVFLHQCI
jgi:hypothetical protein